MPLIEPDGVAGPDRGGKAVVRLSFGDSEALLGAAMDTGEAAGLWSTLKDRDGDAGGSTADFCGDGAEVATCGISADGSGTAIGSGTALG